MAFQDLKRRIRSVKNTSQITKAMEVVSATKMRRSQLIALKGRPYALAALGMLHNIMRRAINPSPLLRGRTVKKTLLTVVTSDKGLAGAFNTNIIRNTERWMREHREERYDVLPVGKKAASYFASRNTKVVRQLTGFGDYISRNQTEPLSDLLWAGYLNHHWDRVIVFYTNFRTTLKQEATAVEVLPIHPESIAETIRAITPEYGIFSETQNETASQKYSYEYAFEPSGEEVLEKLLPVLFNIQVHHIILESNASEHSARMVAMKNASENAKDLIGELTLEFNKARQAGITRELTEITAGKEAIDRP